jgi:cell division protein FtsI (penicillin-binding protein 3)
VKRWEQQNQNPFFRSTRFWVIVAFLAIIALALVARMVYLTIIERSFLLNQGNAREIRTISIPAYRGMILDRNGHSLAMSVPVDSIWLNPQDFPNDPQTTFQLAQVLNLSPLTIHQLIAKNKKRYFVYLKRNVPPSVAQQVQTMAIPGVYFDQGYKRYYPQGETTAQLLGFNNVDDQGIEGLELEYNQQLEGIPGQEKVIKDRLGHVVAVLGVSKIEKPGKNVYLSIDQRIQYLAYRTVKETVEKFHAQTGSVVVLNPRNGEIVAMANYPSFDPNHRIEKETSAYRNRAVTDMFEPGSTMKAFSIASALDSGKYTPDSEVDTGKGVYRIGRNIIHDDSNNGVITVTKVLQVSSNIGAAKLTLSLPPEQLLSLYKRLGFGERTMSGFPGESPGYVPPNRAKWRPIDLATLAFGYGLAVTALQLTHAYAVIADDGLRCPVTFLKRQQAPACPRVMDKKVTDEMQAMLATVVQPGGTGTRARIPDYQVIGKTGTAYIAKKDGRGYDKSNYTSSFVGIAPASHPRLVVAVIIRKPQGQHFGAIVAAPAFAKIILGALRIMNVPPDKLANSKKTTSTTPS